MRRTVRAAALITAFLAGAAALPEGSPPRPADWPGWRGTEASGVSPEAGLPGRLRDPEELRFKVPLPGRGVSSPIVSRGRLYLTAASGARGDRLHLLAFEAVSGRKLWERQLAATGSTQCHPKTSMAAPTPAAGNGLVYALFASADLACFDDQGIIVADFLALPVLGRRMVDTQLNAAHVHPIAGLQPAPCGSLVQCERL